ncbi:unnamed protein product [Closterium sp. Yama58-4]|nr:unnamed protein product [Closterium sp. Yama58-4]
MLAASLNVLAEEGVLFEGVQQEDPAARVDSVAASKPRVLTQKGVLYHEEQQEDAVESVDSVDLEDLARVLLKTLQKYDPNMRCLKRRSHKCIKWEKVNDGTGKQIDMSKKTGEATKATTKTKKTDTTQKVGDPKTSAKVASEKPKGAESGTPAGEKKPEKARAAPKEQARVLLKRWQIEREQNLKGLWCVKRRGYTCIKWEKVKDDAGKEIDMSKKTGEATKTTSEATEKTGKASKKTDTTQKAGDMKTSAKAASEKPKGAASGAPAGEKKPKKAAAGADGNSGAAPTPRDLTQQGLRFETQPEGAVDSVDSVDSMA